MCNLLTEDAVLVMVTQFNHDVSEIVQSVPTLVMSREEEWVPALPDPSRCQ